MDKHININPDNYLETSTGRVWTTERNIAAWSQAYSDFESSLKLMDMNVIVYIVFGVQGSGKTTWIDEFKSKLNKPTVFFDAAMPAIAHRKKVITIAKKYSKNIIAVWLNVTIETALERNAQRVKDKMVSKSAIKSVYSQLEPPSIEEGFTELIVLKENS